MVSDYRGYINELVKKAVETTDSALLFLSPPNPSSLTELALLSLAV